jgi:type I restriction enzyme S subunit
VDEEWEPTTLGQHTDAFRGLSYKGSGLTENGLGIPMHNLNSVYEGGGYKTDGIKFYNLDYKERHLVYSGDIIVTNTEQGHEFKLIGFPAIVPDSFGDTGIFSQHIYRLVPKKETYLSREFIYYLLMSHSMREQVISATNGSTVNMLAIDGLQIPKFKLPPEIKVIEFTEIVSAHWDKISKNNKQARTLEKLRDTLLPKLMSGEVRVEV